MALTTITNVSKQSLPIIVNSIVATNADTGSDIAASIDKQVLLAPGRELNVETSRLDLAQLDKLRNYNLIVYTNR
jgi:hypothetical protein